LQEGNREKRRKKALLKIKRKQTGGSKNEERRQGVRKKRLTRPWSYLEKIKGRLSKSCRVFEKLRKVQKIREHSSAKEYFRKKKKDIL